MLLLTLAGHNVTRVSGLETFGYDMEELKDKFKKLFMCTTSVARESVDMRTCA